jgi:hypothetical protein
VKEIEFVQMWRTSEGQPVLTLVVEGKTHDFALSRDKVQRLMTDSANLLNNLMNEMRNKVDKLSTTA